MQGRIILRIREMLEKYSIALIFFYVRKNARKSTFMISRFDWLANI
jgi:hypothetical protein